MFKSPISLRFIADTYQISKKALKRWGNSPDFEIVKHVNIITDTLPIQSKKKAVQKSIKLNLATRLPEGIGHSIMHHSSRSCFGLQIADYCGYAIWKKWEKNKTEYYEKVKQRVKSEFNIFRSGTSFFY